MSTKQEALDYIATLSSEELREFEKTYGLDRWVKRYSFPEEMYKWFQGGISKHRGDMWENEYIAACTGLGPKTNGDHDATLDAGIVATQNLKGATVEIKFFTSMSPDSAKQIAKRGFALTWGERALRIPEKAGNWLPPKKGTWQQVKPNCAHYGLFSALHGNGAMHYWVPYHLLSRTPGAKNVEAGKIPMGIQHRGHDTEGQVDIRSRLHDLFLLDVTVDTPFITDLTKYNLSKYENLVY